MEDKNKIDENKREPITPSTIRMIASSIGLGAIILDLHLTDYSLGAYQTAETSKCFWLKDGRRVDISMTADGGVISSVTNKPDQERPITKYQGEKTNESRKF